MLYEFYAVVTDPKRVTNPTSSKDAIAEIEKYLKAENISKIYPGHGIMEKTIDLMKRHEITKQKIFDLQLVATMLLNDVTCLYTFNQADFTEFKEIKVLAP